MADVLPLSHLKVLDLTIARAGPTAVRLLTDWGADVIKIEPPPVPGARNDSHTGARVGPDEQNLHRNKRGLALDLKSPDGQEIFRKMLKDADIVVENYRSDVKTRLGVDYETLSALNPRVILASISGFGQDGPYGKRPGVDQIVQGTSGLMSITGEPGGGPIRVGIAISDSCAGYMLGQGILLALLDRERTGKGQWVHTSLLEAMLCTLDFQGARYTMNGEIPGQEGNHHPTSVPMGTFESADGLVNIAASQQYNWEAFCKTLGAGDLLERPEYATSRLRAENKEAIRKDVAEVAARFTTLDLVEKLNTAGLPCGPVNDVGQAFEDPQVRHLKMTRVAHLANRGPINLIRSPIHLSNVDVPEEFHHAGPVPGEHSAEILSELGYDEDRIRSLRDAGVIV